MVVRDFLSRRKRESALARAQKRGWVIVRHLATTDCCASCFSEALASLDHIWIEAVDKAAVGKVSDEEMRSIEVECEAIARRIAAVTAFAANPDIQLGGRQ